MVFSLKSTWVFDPNESMTSIVSVEASSNGRTEYAVGPWLSAPTGQTSAKFPLNYEYSIFYT